jgi:hypothetical protein
MTDAFIYDHVRSPRGRGRPNGSLHGITPMNLTSQVLAALRDRNELDTSLLDDVVLGCVAPVGEQGSNIARVAALNAGYAESVPGKQLNRFCASLSKPSTQRPHRSCPANPMRPSVAAWSVCRAYPWVRMEAPWPPIRKRRTNCILYRKASVPT